MKTLELVEITKKYKNEIILDNVNYVFNDSLCYMLLGENGSGKSTLLKIILGFIYPNKGIIKNQFFNISYIPEKVILPLYIKVIDFLSIIKDIKNDQSDKLEYLLDYFEIRFALFYKLKELSKGMLQKVLIIQSLLGSSEVFIFDEVLNGLDSVMQKKFLDYLQVLKENKCLIIITSHYITYYSDVVDKIIKIKDKKIYDS